MYRRWRCGFCSCAKRFDVSSYLRVLQKDSMKAFRSSCPCGSWKGQTVLGELLSVAALATELPDRSG